MSSQHTHVPVIFDVADMLKFHINASPMAAGQPGRVSGPTLSRAGEGGAGDFAFSGGGNVDTATVEDSGQLQGRRRELVTVLPLHLQAALAS